MLNILQTSSAVLSLTDASWNVPHQAPLVFSREIQPSYLFMSEKPSWIHYKCALCMHMTNLVFEDFSAAHQPKNVGPIVNMFLTFFSFFGEIYNAEFSLERNCYFIQGGLLQYSRLWCGGKVKRIKLEMTKHKAKRLDIILFSNYRHTQYFKMIYNA